MSQRMFVNLLLCTFALLIPSGRDRAVARPSSSFSSTTTVAVDTTQPGPPVSPDLWGTNLTQEANAAETVAQPRFITSTRQIGVTLIRWPGGNNADAYDWKRDEEIRPGFRRRRADGVSLAHILQFTRETGTALNVTVNFGTMNARDAADLVEFLNGPADSPWGARRAALGFPQPLGVRYFEIGNEIGQPHMWYYAWTAENPHTYFFGGEEERRGFYDNAGSQAYDPIGAKGDLFKVRGGTNQTYTLRFPPVRDVRLLWAATQEDAHSRVFEEWHQVDDLSAQPPDARVFTLDAGRGVLRFGNGTHGAVPPAASYFLAEYTTYDHDGFLDFARAMRAAPSNVPIQIGAAMLPFEDGRPITDTQGMREIFSQMDFYVRHQYNAGRVRMDSVEDTHLSPLRQIAATRVDHLATVYDRIRAYGTDIGLPRMPGIGVSEWNIFLDRRYWQLNRTQMGAVIAAEWFARLLNAGDIAPVLFADQFALGGGNLALIRSQTNSSLAPMAYVFQGFSEWAGSHRLPVSVHGPSTLAYDRVISDVVAAAALAPDGRTLHLALVNNAINQPITTTLAISGFTPAAASMWQLRAENPLANNDADPATVVPREQTLPASSLSTVLPPHSVTFLTFRPAATRHYLPLVGHQMPPLFAASSRFGITITGDTFYSFDCERAHRTLAGTTWLVVPWQAVEPEHGKWTFEALDTLVQEVHRCGFDLGLKLVTGHDHWGVQPGGNGRGSMPPRHLEMYREWVSTLVSRYRGQVRAYAIENEVNAPAYWAGTLADYQLLWPVGYAAIKAAAPEATVVDFGMTSTSYAVAVARWRYDHGDLNGAITWLNHYLARRGAPHVQTEEELRTWLDDPRARSDYDIMMWHFQMHPRPDAYQLHFYEAWDLLPPLLEWIRARMDDPERPIEVWEIGYYWGDDASYDRDAQAREVAKLLLTALGEGANRVYYLPYRSLRAAHGKLETVRGLVDGDDSPRPALAAYRTAVEQVGNFTTAARLSAGPEVWAYRFDDKVARWTQEGDVTYERSPRGLIRRTRPAGAVQDR